MPKRLNKIAAEVPVAIKLSMLGERLNMAPVLAPGAVVMEVKYNGFLLDYIRRMINTVDQSELSVSKYMLARQNGYRYRL